MPTLTITRGLPGSGKTTWAAREVAIWGGAIARVNRDDIRERVFGADGKTRFDHGTEQAITAAQQAAVRALLGAGRDVIVDDTNLRLKFARQWADLAVEAGADFTVVDFLDVPVDECILRDALRSDGVGAAVIRDMAQRFLQGKTTLPPVTPTEAVAPLVLPGPDSAPRGTFAEWLCWRFGGQRMFGVLGGWPSWEHLPEADRSYWEREAAAVRRAVERGGFKRKGD